MRTNRLATRLFCAGLLLVLYAAHAVPPAARADDDSNGEQSDKPESVTATVLIKQERRPGEWVVLLSVPADTEAYARHVYPARGPQQSEGDGDGRIGRIWYQRDRLAVAWCFKEFGGRTLTLGVEQRGIILAENALRGYPEWEDLIPLFDDDE